MPSHSSGSTRAVSRSRQRLRRLVEERSGIELALGQLDITFHRDDVHVRAGTAPRRAQPIVRDTKLDFELQGRTVILVDDVLYTGRTIRAAIDALIEFGRPARVQLAVLADRGHRELPIRPDYVGKNLPTSRGDRIQVELVEIDEVDRVVLIPERRRSTVTTDLRVVGGELVPPQPERRHLLSVADLSQRRRRAAARDGALVRAVAGAREQEAADAARAPRDQRLLRVVDAHVVVLRARREAPSADTMTLKSSGSSVDKGESLKDTAQTLSAYDPDVIVLRHRKREPASSSRATPRRAS